MPETDKPTLESLTAAVNEFMQVVERFRVSNQELQTKVDVLTTRLQEKNRQLQQELVDGENTRNFLNAILESINSGVIVVDPNGHVSLFNRAAEIITGLSAQKITGQPYRQVFQHNTGGGAYSPLYTLTTGRELQHREKSIVTADREQKNVEYSTTVIRDGKGQTLGIAEIINDISQLKELEERLSHAQTLAALGEMAAGVAHEIRNPLGGISGYAGLLNRQMEADDPRKKLVAHITEGAIRLNAIVENLLTYTRPCRLRPAPVGINHFLREFSKSYARDHQGVELELNLLLDERELSLDREQFVQVMHNLTENAYQAGAHHVLISVTHVYPVSTFDILDEKEREELHRLFSHLEITVSDDGPGMEADVLNRLFTPFFSTKDKGNGLGLSICRKLVHLHGGEITAASQPGGGAVFTVSLPLYRDYD